jgi:DeoR/GlpR family transcriptional regulator of sugar metabolism
VAGLEKELSISAATARRDLAVLERQGEVKRTHGGAVPPGLAQHEDSFQQRLGEAVEAKQRLARVAAALLGADGHLTEPNPLEAEVKRAMIRRSESPVLLADGRKFARRGASVIAHVSEASLVITADAGGEHVERLEHLGVEVQSV